MCQVQPALLLPLLLQVVQQQDAHGPAAASPHPAYPARDIPNVDDIFVPVIHKQTLKQLVA